MSEMRHKMNNETQGNVPAPKEAAPLVLDLQDINLVDVVSQVCKEFSATSAGQRAKVSCRSLVDELVVSLDRQQLTEALNILLNNSVRFSPGDCAINVTLGRGENLTALVQIADNSIGIRDEYKATAFDPVVDGEGIGLDKVKNIVVAHGGTIRLEDNPGGGTIFFISLPLVEVVVVDEADIIVE